MGREVAQTAVQAGSTVLLFDTRHTATIDAQNTIFHNRTRWLLKNNSTSLPLICLGSVDVSA